MNGFRCFLALMSPPAFEDLITHALRSLSRLSSASVQFILIRANFPVFCPLQLLYDWVPVELDGRARPVRTIRMLGWRMRWAAYVNRRIAAFPAKGTLSGQRAVRAGASFVYLCYQRLSDAALTSWRASSVCPLVGISGNAMTNGRGRAWVWQAGCQPASQPGRSSAKVNVPNTSITRAEVIWMTRNVGKLHSHHSSLKLRAFHSIQLMAYINSRAPNELQPASELGIPH